ncbi:hypothetical protein GW17_00051336 [Ensete ventricosum]|nr:hypothetical protein GW17_00051336 [Ensete ventricosum]
MCHPWPSRKGWLPAMRPLAGVAAPAARGHHRQCRGGGGGARHRGSMKVTTRPTMPWREITLYGYAIIRRNR